MFYNWVPTKTIPLKGAWHVKTFCICVSDIHPYPNICYVPSAIGLFRVKWSLSRSLERYYCWIREVFDSACSRGYAATRREVIFIDFLTGYVCTVLCVPILGVMYGTAIGRYWAGKGGTYKRTDRVDRQCFDGWWSGVIVGDRSTTYIGVVNSTSSDL